jgi:hypothetical protein
MKSEGKIVEMFAIIVLYNYCRPWSFHETGNQNIRNNFLDNVRCSLVVSKCKL